MLFARSLFVGAHLDDIELAAAGLVARLTEKGAAVSFLVLSQSDYVHYSGIYGRGSDGAVQEGLAAASLLGVNDVAILTYPTKDIENHSSVVESINRQIDQFDPTVIFTHWPFDTHRSHANTALATIAAGRYRNSILMYEPITPAGRSYVGFRPQMYVDVTDSMERKIQSLKCHETEYKKYGEEWIEGVESRARYRGFEMGVRYAECFEVLRLEATI